MRADVTEIRSVRQRVLRIQIDVSPIEFRIHRLLGRWNEALAENHVSRVETPRVSAAEQDRVLLHLRINPKGRSEHVVPKPVAKEMSALLVIGPMRKHWVDRH